MAVDSHSVTTSEVATWLPQLMELCVARGEGEYYIVLEQLVEAELEREGPGPAKLERRIIGTHEAWYRKRWKLRARTTPSGVKAAREIAAYLRSYRHGDDDLATRTFGNVLACYDELPKELEGKTLLKLNKHLVEALAYLKAYHVAPLDRVREYWRACLAITPERRTQARAQGKAPGATVDACGADCFPIGNLMANDVHRTVAMLLRAFELAMGLRLSEVREYYAKADLLVSQYPMLLPLDLAYAFARAARGETKGWNHAYGYNIHRILHEFRTATLTGSRR